MPLRTKHETARWLATSGFVVLATGCGEPAPSWSAQLLADSPCYDVDVSDGLQDGVELDTLFRCLDHHGHLAPLRPLADALQSDGGGAGDRLAEAQRAASAVDLDPFAGVAAAAAWLSAGDRPTDAVLRTVAEVVTGVPADDLVATPSQAHRLECSPLHALGPALPGIATDLLDTPAALGEVATALRHDAAPAWLSAMADASERAGVDGWLRAVGESRPLTLSPDNDRHPDASGDSVRDLVVVWWLRDGATLETLAPVLAVVLDGPSERKALVDAVAIAHDRGDLEQVGASLGWLAQVDLGGQPLPVGEPSALARILRVLASTNEPVECELDLWLTSFEWSFDNLAVRLLQWVTTLDDDGIDDAGSLLGSLSDNAVSEAVLEAAIASGTCPSITHETLDDLDAVLLLFEDEAGPARRVVVDVLRAIPDERFPSVADGITVVWQGGALPPLEEFLRDAGSTQAVGGLGRWVGALAEPTPGSHVRLEDGLALVHELAADPTRRGHLHSLGEAALGRDESWEAIDRAAALLTHDGAELASLPSLLRDVLAHDPQLALLEPVRVVLATDDVVRPLLQVMSEPGVVAALVPTHSDPESPAPMPWFGLQLTNGTLRGWLEVIRDLLGEAGATPAEPAQAR